jgi:hypothetical protein
VSCRIYVPEAWRWPNLVGLVTEFSFQEVHQILPGGDLKLAKNLVWSVGVGVGLTPAGNRIVYKSRFEYTFGRDH